MRSRRDEVRAHGTTEAIEDSQPCRQRRGRAQGFSMHTHRAATSKSAGTRPRLRRRTDYFAYDDLDRLTGLGHDAPPVTVAASLHGNITSKAGVGTYDYSAAGGGSRCTRRARSRTVAPRERSFTTRQATNSNATAARKAGGRRVHVVQPAGIDHRHCIRPNDDLRIRRRPHSRPHPKLVQQANVRPSTLATSMNASMTTLAAPRSLRISTEFSREIDR
jgi:hypothetical protein